MVLLTYFLHSKTYTQNANGENYEKKWYDNTKAIVGDYLDHVPTPTCLRNHAFIQETIAGGGPIHMVTMEAFQDPHLEEIGWENFLGMTVGQGFGQLKISIQISKSELTTFGTICHGFLCICSELGVVDPRTYLHQNISGATIA